MGIALALAGIKLMNLMRRDVEFALEILNLQEIVEFDVNWKQGRGVSA